MVLVSKIDRPPPKNQIAPFAYESDKKKKFFLRMEGCLREEGFFLWSGRGLIKNLFRYVSEMKKIFFEGRFF